MEDKTYIDITAPTWKIYVRKMKRIEKTYNKAKTKAWDAFQQEVDNVMEKHKLEKSRNKERR